MRVAPTIELSPEERARLSRIGQRTTADGLRARIVLLAANGLDDQEIGRRLDTHRLTVARWRRRFLVGRIRAVEEGSAPLRPSVIAPETVRRIVRATLDGPDRRGRGHSLRGLGSRFGVSHTTVKRIWDAYGVRPQRHGSLPNRADPRQIASARDVIGVYLRPDAAALALNLEAPPGVHTHASRRTAAQESLRVPSAASPALLLLDQLGSFTPQTFPAVDSHGLMRFLAGLATRVPRDLPIRVVATRPPKDDRAALERWLTVHPRVELLAETDLAAWRSRVADELRTIAETPTPRGRHQSRAELSRSLSRHLASYRSGSGEFEWLAPSSAVAGGEAGYTLRHDLAASGHPGFMTPRSSKESGPSTTNEALRESARHVLRRYLHVGARERVTIEAWSMTLDYANAFVLESLRLGARPLLLFQDEPTYWAATTEVPAKWLAALGEHRRAALERTDVLVSFFGPSDRERFHSLPSRVLSPVCEYQDAVYAAAAKAGARAVQMAVGRVSGPSAKMYGVEEAAWRRELLDGTLVDPQTLRRRGRRIAQLLERGRDLIVQHSNGTRLHLRLKGRKTVVSDGAVSRSRRKADWNLVTLPAGVLAVAVDESFGEGSFVSNLPSCVGLSDSVGEFEEGRWEFAGGSLRRYHYTRGQELFARSYERAKAGKERPGFLSIGLNDRLHHAPLLEDQGLGTVTLNIGRNSSAGGNNRTEWWGWLYLTGADVAVDGNPLVRAGRVVA
ncbi:MAG TPA: helix-turn-helix domain-containing protein [Thermoplasmata archaeon]|nr:helix-turn-helix domain-containing protein [Thermoplasmata archaeon]